MASRRVISSITPHEGNHREARRATLDSSVAALWLWRPGKTVEVPGRHV
jgi:hypothetical protein